MNPERQNFAKEKRNFDERADELERKLATQLDLAFEQCNTTTQTTTLIQMISTIIFRPKIFEALKFRYTDVVTNFSREVDQVKRTYDRGMANVEQGGLAALPVGPGQAPVSGALKWIRSLRARIVVPRVNFAYLDYEYGR